MNTHLPQLDGLRGIAILLVIIGHVIVFDWGMGITRLGPIPPLGVDLFFVLSGFLITGILLRTREQPNYFLNFYARRALRTWPIYAALLVFLFAIANGRIRVLALPSYLHWQYFACYVQNLVYYRKAGMGPMQTSVTWSLAVEEQFYLIWPIFVRIIPKSRLWLFLIPVILIAPVARAIAPHWGIDPYPNPICRFDAMAMGSLLAVWIDLKSPDGSKIVKVALTIIGIAFCAEFLGNLLGVAQLLSKSFAASIFTAVLALSLGTNSLAAVLKFAPLRYAGKISYCMYLVHTVLGHLVEEYLPGRNMQTGILRAGIILLSTFAVATLSWYGFESRVLRLKRFFESRGRSAFARTSNIATGGALRQEA